MEDAFRPDGLPVLVGSLPLADHGDAVRMVFDHTPEIPLWVQLPARPREGMISQFLPGMPGLCVEGERTFIDSDGASFPDDLLGFYESYMAVTEGGMDMEGSPFVLSPDTAAGFFTLVERLDTLDHPPVAIKGQVTGPITFTTGVADRNRRAIFYDLQARDAAVKLLAQKARWQVERLARFGCPVIVFLDEPALAGFGSSEMISISRDEVLACLAEVVAAIHQAGGLAGIHVCANTDWSLILEAAVDVINFDAYAYFDRFVLYGGLIRSFIDAGGILAWGIVPTLDPDALDRETVDSLVERWQSHFHRIVALGIDAAALRSQSLISPSCGAGSLDPDRALRVLRLTRAVSDRVRQAVRP